MRLFLLSCLILVSTFAMSGEPNIAKDTVTAVSNGDTVTITVTVDVSSEKAFILNQLKEKKITEEAAKKTFTVRAYSKANSALANVIRTHQITEKQLEEQAKSHKDNIDSQIKEIKAAREKVLDPNK